MTTFQERGVVAMALGAQAAIATAGELDVGFGAGGVLSTDFGGTYDWAYATAVQPDGIPVDLEEDRG